ncbi:MAG TPA: hypothetical protein VMW75_10775, partial [Thermoanaerobaculia bacterium]|nr:hypothetical protein [Thermoanaerobaculia bacterium]
GWGRVADRGPAAGRGWGRVAHRGHGACGEQAANASQQHRRASAPAAAAGAPAHPGRRPTRKHC